MRDFLFITPIFGAHALDTALSFQVRSLVPPPVFNRSTRENSTRMALTYQYLKTSLLSVGDFMKLVPFNNTVDPSIILSGIIQFQSTTLKSVISIDEIDALAVYIEESTTPVPSTETFLLVLAPVIAYGAASFNLSNLLTAQFMPVGITNFPADGSIHQARAHYMSLFESSLHELYAYCEANGIEYNNLHSVSDCPIFLG